MGALSSSLIATFDLLELRKFMTAQVKFLGLVDTGVPFILTYSSKYSRLWRRKKTINIFSDLLKTNIFYNALGVCMK